MVVSEVVAETFETWIFLETLTLKKITFVVEFIFISFSKGKKNKKKQRNVLHKDLPVPQTPHVFLQYFVNTTFLPQSSSFLSLHVWVLTLKSSHSE